MAYLFYRSEMSIVKTVLVWLTMTTSFCPSQVAAVIQGKTCSPSVIVHPEAQVFVGVFLDIHNPAKECLQVNAEAVEVFEILRWFTALLNQNFGEVSSRIVKDNFVPGISIGLKVFDTCGLSKFPAPQLKSLFPNIDWLSQNSSAYELCDEGDNKLIVGVIDLSDILNHDSVRYLFSLRRIPYIRLRTSNYEIASEFSTVLVNFVKTLSWNQTVVVYDGQDSTSEDILKHWYTISSSPKDFLCVALYADLHEDLNVLATKLESISPSPAVIVVDSKPNSRWKAFYTKLKASHHSWFLSSAANLGAFAVPSNSNQSVFFVNHDPGHIPAFETYWNRRKSLSLMKHDDSQWVLEYLAQKKKCRLPTAEITEFNRQFSECMSVNFAEKSVDLAQRHRLIPPTIYAMNFLANALRNAWSKECNKVPGVCDNLRSLERAQFYDTYFLPLQLKHGGPGSRVPSGITGERREGDPVERVANVRFGLFSLKDSSVQEVLVEDANGSIQVLKKDQEFPRVDCGKCTKCISFQNEDSVREIASPVWLESFQPNTLTSSTETKDLLSPQESSVKEILAEVKNLPVVDFDDDATDTQTEVDENAEVKSFRQHILIPALFRIHLQGPTPLQCGTQINPEAIANIEAFLWALEQINKNTNLLPNIELGAVIFDTCSSALKATHVLSSLISAEGDAMVDELDLDPDSFVTFISAVGSTETPSVLEVLGPMGITTISTKDSTRPRALINIYHLQIETPVGIVAKAMADTLHHLGWQNIVIVHSQNDLEAVRGFDTFYQLTKNYNICSEVHVMPVSGDFFTSEVLGKQTVVVLWLSSLDTQQFWESYRSFGNVDNNCVFIATEIILDVIKDTKANVISFKPERSAVPEFIEKFRKLNPSINTRNPWFQEYWDQVQNCTNCRANNGSTLELSMSKSSTDMIQAVYMVVSAVSRLIGDFCEQGRPFESLSLCISNTYLRFTGTDRADRSNGDFTFTEDGYGNTNIEVLMRSSSHSWVEFGMYNISDGLAYNKTVTGTKNQTFQISDFVATCPTVEPEVAIASKDWEPTIYMEVNSNASLKIISLISIHQAGQRPFTCGAINAPSAWNNVNSFIIAIDDANIRLGSKKLGAIVIDSCGRNELSQKRFLSLLANEDARFPEASIPKILLTLSIDSNAVLALSSVYKDEPVAHIALNGTTPTSVTESDNSAWLSLETSASEEIQAMFDLLVQLDWKHVVLFYANSPRGKRRSKKLKDNLAVTDICVGGDVVVGADFVISDRFVNSLPEKAAAVVLLDTVEDVEYLFDTTLRFNLTSKLIFLLDTAWGLRTVPDFVSALSLTLENPAISAQPSLPNVQSRWPQDWYEEFYQEQFRCRFNNSKVPSVTYSASCGNFSVNYETSYADDITYVIDNVRKVMEKLSCMEGRCVLDDRTAFNMLLEKSLKKSLQVWDLRTKKPLLVGTFKERQLNLRWNLVAREIMECMDGPCLDVCASQSPIYANRTQPVPLAMDYNFHSSWGIAVLIFTSLGLLVELLCVWYFYRALPAKLALLTYLGLLGLLLLYFDNVFFLMQASPVTCSLRRFLTGFAYSVIFSAMLTKVTSVWKKMGYPVGSLTGPVSTEEVKRITGSALHALALILVQIILLAAWLLLVPSDVDLITPGQILRCTPGSSFELALVLSLSYPLLMLITTVVFGLCVIRSSEGMSETKAVIGCCISVGFTWICMSLVATQASYDFKDPAFVVGNLVCAKIFLFGLYGKMVYEMALNRNEGSGLAVLSQFSNKNVSIVSNQFASQSRNTSQRRRIEVVPVERQDSLLGEDNTLDLAAFDLRRKPSSRSNRLNVGFTNSGTSSDGDTTQHSNVPSPVFPHRHQPSVSDSRQSSKSQAFTIEGDRDLSEAEEVQVTRMRVPRNTLHGNPMVAVPYYQTDGNDSATNMGLLPLVRRIGSRQMLLLGGESSAHGKSSDGLRQMKFGSADCRIRGYLKIKSAVQNIICPKALFHIIVV